MLLPTRGRITCLQAETGTKIFAVINVSLAALCTLVTFAGFLYFSIAMIIEFNTPTRNQYNGLGDMALVCMIVGCMVLLMLSLIAFVFAIFLVNGSFKNQPEHIKVYFVYGVIVDTLCLFSVVAHYVLTKFEDCTTFVILSFICFIYSLILAMINMTYTKKTAAIDQYSPKTLINNEKC